MLIYLLNIGLLEDFVDNVSVLGLSPQTIEKRMIYLESIGERPTIPILKLNNSDFYSQYKINERDLNKVKEKPLAQTIIENKYANYISNDAKFLNLEGLKAVNEVNKQIEELGVVNRNLEYVKKGYSYSLIKIRENVHKIISNISDYNNISFLDMTEIYTMAILGNKKVDEKEINEIRESVKIRELETLDTSQQQILDTPKIEVISETEGLEDVMEKQTVIENIFENPDTVDGVDIDDLDSIDVFDKYSGIRKDRLVFPEDEEEIEDFEDHRLENQIELDLENETEEWSELVIQKPGIDEKEKMISEMRNEIEEMNRTLQSIRLKKEKEKLEQEKANLEKKIRAELEEEMAEKLKAIEKEREALKIIERDKLNQELEKVDSDSPVEEVEESKPKFRGIRLVEEDEEIEEVLDEIVDEVEEIEEETIEPVEQEVITEEAEKPIEEATQEVVPEESKIYQEIQIEEDTKDDDNIIDINQIRQDDTVKIAVDTIDDYSEFEQEEPKIFFGLDDYGYFAKYTESEDITKLQMQLNEIYKQKKNEDQEDWN